MTYLRDRQKDKGRKRKEDSEKVEGKIDGPILTERKRNDDMAKG